MTHERTKTLRLSALFMLGVLATAACTRAVEPDPSTWLALYPAAMGLAGCALRGRVAFAPTALATVLYALGLVVHGGGLARLSPESTALVLCFGTALALLWLRQRQLAAALAECAGSR